MSGQRFNTGEKISFTAATLILVGTIALYLQAVFGPDIDGVNPIIFMLGLGAGIALALIPWATSAQRERARGLVEFGNDDSAE